MGHGSPLFFWPLRKGRISRNAAARPDVVSTSLIPSTSNVCGKTSTVYGLGICISCLAKSAAKALYNDGQAVGTVASLSVLASFVRTLHTQEESNSLLL